jgi:SOS response regulatory protein OraA/RecX
MRELSKTQVRQRLRRRGVEPEVAEDIITSLVDLGALNEERLALAAARRETAIRGRGPTRARLALKALGLGDDTVNSALDCVLCRRARSTAPPSAASQAPSCARASTSRRS